MSEQGTDRYGAEYKRTDNDFYFKWLEQDNCICNICHGTGAKIEFRYVTRNYESARRNGKICKNLQAHGHSFWICPICIDNLVKKSGGLVKVLVKADMKGEPMSDLIDRQQAIDEVINLWADKPFGNPTLVEIKGCIEALPSAQPQRKKGKWILETFQIRCSQCNKLFSDSLFTSKYCPNCGARMEGEANE